MKIEVSTLLVGVLVLVGFGAIVFVVSSKNNSDTPQSNKSSSDSKNTNPQINSSQLFVDTRTGRFPVYSESELLMLAEVADGYRSGSSNTPSVTTVSTKMDEIRPIR
jgi:hypothetical protein